MITCDKCEAACCRKLVIELNKPTTKEGYNDIRWYLYHGVKVYIDKNDKTWNLEFDLKCMQLDEKNRCKIYSVRPEICKETKVSSCEKNKPDIEVMFKTVEEFEEWLKKNKR